MPDNEGMAQTLLTSTGMSRASGCLSLVALAALAACGGGQSADDSGQASVSALGDKFVTLGYGRGGRWSTMTASFPSIDTALIPVGSQGFASDMLAPTDELPSASGDGTGAFRTVCEFSHMAFDDPIVYPGQPGKSHLHVFFGNTGTSANSTAASIANTGNSTCRGGTINRSGYWAPAMIDTRDGTPVTPQSMVIYYKTGYNGVKPGDIKSLPQGLRMMAEAPIPCR